MDAKGPETRAGRHLSAEHFAAEYAAAHITMTPRRPPASPAPRRCGSRRRAARATAGACRPLRPLDLSERARRDRPPAARRRVRDGQPNAGPGGDRGAHASSRFRDGTAAAPGLGLDPRMGRQPSCTSAWGRGPGLHRWNHARVGSPVLQQFRDPQCCNSSSIDWRYQLPCRRHRSGPTGLDP